MAAYKSKENKFPFVLIGAPLAGPPPTSGRKAWKRTDGGALFYFFQVSDLWKLLRNMKAR